LRLLTALTLNDFLNSIFLAQHSIIHELTAKLMQRSAAISNLSSHSAKFCALRNFIRGTFSAFFPLLNPYFKDYGFQYRFRTG
jgi:hypothetical protein